MLASRIVLVVAAVLLCASLAYAADGADSKPPVSTAAPSPSKAKEPRLQDVPEGGLPPVEGPVHLRADPRGEIPPRPTSLQETLARFYPTWTWVRDPEELTLNASTSHDTVTWTPQAGACYVAVAYDTRIADFGARQRKAKGKLRWWEAGTDVDIQVREAGSDVLIGNDESRQLIPRAQWCSDGTPVRIRVQLGVPKEATDDVDIRWGVAVDPNTLSPLRFAGTDALARRLTWAQSVVTPRGEPRSAPAVFDVAGATLVRATIPVPAAGCEVLIAVGEAGIEDISIAFQHPDRDEGDFALGPVAAVPVCANSAGGHSTRDVLVGVRSGKGRVALQRFAFSP